MPHIPLPDDAPGIRGLLAYKPATGTKIAQLIHQVLRGDSPLLAADRERIAAHVSRLNDCEFCARSHAATIPHLDRAAGRISEVDPADQSVAPSAHEGAPEADPKLLALLDVAAAVARSGREVTPSLVDRARAAGANDEEIHDTVLIAAAFSMLNRYVDGLGAVTPTDDEAYTAMGAHLATDGYLGAAPVAG